MSRNYQSIHIGSCTEIKDTMVTQSPPQACKNETITVSCVLTLPNAEDTFEPYAGDFKPRFIIGLINETILESTINKNDAENFDLSRFTAASNAGNSTEVSGSITLHRYIKDTDKGLRMGCGNGYKVGGKGDLIQFNKTLNLTQAGMFAYYTNTVCVFYLKEVIILCRSVPEE